MMAWATGPCADSAATAWTVSRVLGLAWVTTNRKGFAAAWTSSTVLPTARRSCGLGRVGIRTRSAVATTARMESVMAGGVSITATAKPAVFSDESFWGRSAIVVVASAGESLSRTFHQADNE